MDIRGRAVRAPLVYIDGEFEKDMVVIVDDKGLITEVKKYNGEDAVELGDKAIIPGLISAHSHAFHRGLRGRSNIGQSKADSFWGWRNDMYEYVQKTTKESFYEICRDTFAEMRRSGITSLGEFHYMHHSDENYEYDLDKVILKAAKDVGLRICLLLTYYEQAGLGGKELETAQRRFHTRSMDGFWKNFDELSLSLDPTTQSLGVAAHSIRAVSLPNAILLRDEAIKRHLPFHMHMEEQPQEILDCQAVLKETPSETVLKHLSPDGLFTGVHCTYTMPKSLNQLIEKQANICVCPLTEGYLGDGIIDLSTASSGKTICLGTDCNNRLCMAEEMRWLAYGQQMVTNRRGVGCLPNGAASLLECATVNGAKSLGLEGKCGKLKPGFCCDFITLDLKAAQLKNVTPDGLIDAFVFGCSTDAVVKDSCINGILQQY